MINESGIERSERYTVTISSITSDFVTGDGSIVHGFIVIVRGKAIDHDYGSPPEIVTGVLDDAVRFETVTGWLSETGRDEFVFRFHTTDLAPGEHFVHVVASSRDGSSHALSEKRKFTLLPTLGYMPAKAYASTWACAMIDWADRPPSAIATPPELRRVRPGDILNFRGWAIDTIAADSAADAFLILDERLAFRLECRQWRPDVAAAFGFAEAAYCGFVGTIVTEGLGPGLHTAQCFVLAKNYFATYRTDVVFMFEIVDDPQAAS